VKADEEGWVYFAQCDTTARIKIGFTTDIEKRRAALNSCSSTATKILAQVRGTRETEEVFHRRYHHARVHGLSSREWFLPTHQLLWYIGTLGGKPIDAPVPTAEDLSRKQAAIFSGAREQFDALVCELKAALTGDGDHLKHRYEHDGARWSNQLLRDIAYLREQVAPLVAKIRAEESFQMACVAQFLDAKDAQRQQSTEKAA
jgi:hypothetical protein